MHGKGFKVVHLTRKNKLVTMLIISYEYNKTCPLPIRNCFYKLKMYLRVRNPKMIVREGEILYDNIDSSYYQPMASIYQIYREIIFTKEHALI